MPRPDTVFSGPDLCALSAREVIAFLRKGELSPADLVEASAARITDVEPKVNAIVTPCPERARRAAARGLVRHTAQAGWLGALPIAIKDLTEVEGVRTTFGTRGFADHVPDRSDPLVLRLEARGGIVMGKTNTPELGAGGATFNDVFGVTRNPWNTARHAGGSSGGSAVALATGEVWLAHGSDLGGSLRTPAAFNGIVGLRPTPGVAGGASAETGFQIDGVQGPMARDVADCALFLDAMAGFDPVWPISFPAPDRPYSHAVERADPARLRIAYSPDLDGFAPVAPEIDAILRGALGQAERVGAAVTLDCPDLSGLNDIYRTLRAMAWAAGAGHMPAEVQAHFKPALRENIAAGQDGALTLAAVHAAQRGRSRIYHAMRSFLSEVDVLACPVAGCPPGPVEEEYPTEIAGVPMADYLDWLRFSFLATTAALPAISVPAGFTRDGLPVGVQLVGPPRGEAALISAARAVEMALDLPRGPIDPMGPAAPRGA